MAQYAMTGGGASGGAGGDGGDGGDGHVGVFMSERAKCIVVLFGGDFFLIIN